MWKSWKENFEMLWNSQNRHGNRNWQSSNYFEVLNRRRKHLESRESEGHSHDQLMIQCCKAISAFKKHLLLWLALYSEQWENKMIAQTVAKPNRTLNCLLSAELRLSTVDRLGFVATAVDFSSLWAVRAMAMKTTKKRFMRKKKISQQVHSSVLNSGTNSVFQQWSSHLEWHLHRPKRY